MYLMLLNFCFYTGHCTVQKPGEIFPSLEREIRISVANRFMSFVSEICSALI